MLVFATFPLLPSAARSGTVLRIADRSLRQVVHADLADPELRILQKDGHAVKLEKVA